MNSLHKRSTSCSVSQQPVSEASESTRGHGSSASFHLQTQNPRLYTAPTGQTYVTYEQQPDAEPNAKPYEIKLEAPPTFAEKMGYFRRKGDISLPSHSPSLKWREDAGPGRGQFAHRFNLIFRRRFGLPKVVWLALLFSGIGILLYLTISQLVALCFYLLARSSTSTKSCNPFVPGNGTLHINHADADGTYWKSHTPNCPAPTFFKQLRHGQEDMNWLHNRTVLLIGDMLEREHVHEFCNLLGLQSQTVRGRPSADQHPTEAPTVSTRGSRALKRSMRDVSLPQTCYVPQYNFMLTSVFHFGLDQEDYWSKSDLYNQPGLLEHRMADHIVPFVSKLIKGGRGKPDLVEVSTGSFDLMRWAQQDIEAGGDPTALLTKERLVWFQYRLAVLLESVRKRFPSSLRVWRGLTMPTDQAAELAYFQHRIGKAQADDRPHFSPERIAQLEKITGEVLAKQSNKGGFRTSPWPKLIAGNAVHQPDRLHGSPGAPGTVLWAEVMLHDLHQAITERKN